MYLDLHGTRKFSSVSYLAYPNGPEGETSGNVKENIETREDAQADAQAESEAEPDSGGDAESESERGQSNEGSSEGYGTDPDAEYFEKVPMLWLRNLLKIFPMYIYGNILNS